MKIKNILLVVIAGAVSFTSCMKDVEEPAVEISAPVLQNPNGSTTYYLSEDNKDAAFETFLWSAAYLGEGTEASYEVQFDKASGDFTNAKSLPVTTELYSKVTNAEMNQMLRELGVEAEMATPLQVRVKAMGGAEDLYSVPVGMLVNRYIYEDEIIVWGLVGSSVDVEHQALTYNEGEGVWKALILLNEGTFVFKDKSYRQTVLGDDGNKTGALVEAGDPIVTENAVYSIVLDVENMTYTIEESEFPNNIYLVGAHVGWDNAAATAHKNFLNGVYEIYQYSEEAFECKWIPQLGSWDNDFGDDPENPGKLIVDGEKNVSVPEGGMWLFTVDLANNEWTVVKTNWGIIGSSTASGWDAQTDFDNFDAETNTYTMNADLTGGELKFRGTSDWSVNYGGEGLSGEPIPDGSNIKIEEAGNYTITLVLGHGGNYSYSITKN